MKSRLRSSSNVRAAVQSDTVLRLVAILIAGLLLVCRANADLYVSSGKLIPLTSGVAHFNEATGQLLSTFAGNLVPSGLAFGRTGTST